MLVLSTLQAYFTIALATRSCVGSRTQPSSGPHVFELDDVLAIHRRTKELIMTISSHVFVPLELLVFDEYFSAHYAFYFVIGQLSRTAVLQACDLQPMLVSDV